MKILLNTTIIMNIVWGISEFITIFIGKSVSDRAAYFVRTIFNVSTIYFLIALKHLLFK